MNAYRRLYIPGGTYFFTVAVLAREHHDLIPHASWLKACIRAEQQIAPFAVLAAVLLPDHLHMIWRLPDNDADYSGRWRRIKARFSRALRPYYVRRSVNRKGERGIWQRRFWEHVIRDERELSACIHYIHMNPIKHGHVATPDAWEHTTFHAWQQRQIAWHSARRHTHRSRPAPAASYRAANFCLSANCFHRTASLCTNAPSSAGVLRRTSAPCSAIFFATTGSDKA